MLSQNLLNGRRVPDEWIVGYGPNRSLPGGKTAKPLHLFRAELPGGMYAFRREIEPRLTAEYQRDPTSVARQLSVYVTEH